MRSSTKMIFIPADSNMFDTTDGRRFSVYNPPRTLAAFLAGVLFGVILTVALATVIVETAPSRHVTRECSSYLTDRVGAKHEIVLPCQIIGRLEV